jgi:glucuronate isomerase
MLTAAEIEKFKSCMLYEFGVMDHKRGWTQQYHWALYGTITAVCSIN